MLKKLFLSALISAMLVFGYVHAESSETVKVPVLMYHSVCEGNSNAIISPQNFRKHLEAIRDNGFTPVSLRDLVNFVDYGEALPQKPVCITFDDGYSNNYLEAFPCLREFGFKATIFAIGSSVGKDTYKGTIHKMNGHFDYDEAREMVESGLISVQSHSFDMHQWAAFESNVRPRENVLRLQSENLLDYVQKFEGDFLKSKESLETELGEEVIGFAYPSGKYNHITEYLLKKNGVRATFTTTVGQNYVKKYDRNSLYNMNRYNIYDGVSADTLLRWLNED